MERQRQSWGPGPDQVPAGNLRGRAIKPLPFAPSHLSHLVPPGPTWLPSPASPVAAAFGGNALPWALMLC